MVHLSLSSTFASCHVRGRDKTHGPADGTKCSPASLFLCSSLNATLDGIQSRHSQRTLLRTARGLYRRYHSNLSAWCNAPGTPSLCQSLGRKTLPVIGVRGEMAGHLRHSSSLQAHQLWTESSSRQAPARPDGPPCQVLEGRVRLPRRYYVCALTDAGRALPNDGCVSPHSEQEQYSPRARPKRRPPKGVIVGGLCSIVRGRVLGAECMLLSAGKALAGRRKRAKSPASLVSLTHPGQPANRLPSALGTSFEMREWQPPSWHPVK